MLNKWTAKLFNIWTGSVHVWTGIEQVLENGGGHDLVWSHSSREFVWKTKKNQGIASEALDATLKAIGVNLFRAAAVRKAANYDKADINKAITTLNHTIFIIKEHFITTLSHWVYICHIFISEGGDNSCWIKIDKLINASRSK